MNTENNNKRTAESNKVIDMDFNEWWEQFIVNMHDNEPEYFKRFIDPDEPGSALEFTAPIARKAYQAAIEHCKPQWISVEDAKSVLKQAVAESVVVESLANDEIRIYFGYKEPLGVMDRMAVAQTLQVLIASILPNPQRKE